MRLTSDQQIGLSLLFLIIFCVLVGDIDCEGRRRCIKDTLQQSGFGAEEIEAAKQACD